MDSAIAGPTFGVAGGAEDEDTKSEARAEPIRAPPVGGIYDYGAIGNLHTAALVSRFGSVDWLCVPHFSSPSLFGRLISPSRGGFQSVLPADGFERADQDYIPSTNVLRTRFLLGYGRRLIVYDFMPCRTDIPEEGDPRIVRILEAVGGSVDVSVAVEPRFRYAQTPTAWTADGLILTANCPDGDQLKVRLPWPATIDGARAGVARGRLEPGRRRAVELAWGDVPDPQEGPESLKMSTETFWREWAHREDAPIHRISGSWHPWIERSELLLKLLSHAGTGAFVAAPTTSLPEWPGGTRNWDYRYVWLRDAAFTAQVLTMLGHLPEARSYLQWIISRLEAEGPHGRLKVVYGAHGESDLAEHELSDFEGFEHSKPVRVGNAAAGQTQLDIYGEILDSAAMLADLEPEFLRAHWPVLSRLTDDVSKLWRLPDSGIWELRAPPAHHVHSKVMCWVALDRAIRIAEHLGGDPRIDEWRSTAQQLRQLILERGFDPERRTFVQAFERPVMDATSLRIPLTGFLPFDDPRVLGTLAAVERELARGPFVYRYRGDDGIPDPEGAFLLCSFWLVECLARSGQRAAALARWRPLLEVASPLGLFAEEYDPVARRPLGNYPQAFTHIGVLRAALALGFTSPRRVIATVPARAAAVLRTG